MEKSEVCKVCGFYIVAGGRYPDQLAQEKGYCGEGCESVAETVNEFNQRAAEENQ